MKTVSQQNKNATGVKSRLEGARETALVNPTLKADIIINTDMIATTEII